MKKATPFLLLLCVLCTIIMLHCFHLISNNYRSALAFEAVIPPKSTQLNINTASEQELNTLPGISRTLARRIVAYRENNGPFCKIDELKNIKGITDATLEGITPYITIGDSL